MLSNADKLKADLIRFNDVDGFTGSYEHAVQGEATISDRPHLSLHRRPLGFNSAQPTRLKAEPFTIKVGC